MTVSMVRTAGDRADISDLTIVPRSLYHTTGRSAFCPVRDTTLISIATNEIWLSWAILLMQHRRSVLVGGRPDEDPRVLHRRRLTYKLMNAKLTAPEEDALSDETLYGIVAAGVAEHRVSGAKEANKHLEAGLTLWEMRRKKGMRQQITYPIGLVFCNAYIGIGVDNFFKHYVTLVTTGSAMAQRLKSIQTWNRELRQLVSDSRHRPEVAGEKPVLGHPSEEWLKARDLVCAKHSIIRGHVRQMLDDKSAVGTRTCLGALFAMNTTLWACRYNESEAIEFIGELLHYLVKSEPAPVLDSRPQLTSMAAMYIVGFCGSNVQQRYGTSRTRFDLWDVIRFVELMMLIRESSRDRMKSALASWLLVDVDDPEELILWTDEERDRMITEVEGAWGQKQFGQVDRGIRDHKDNS